MARLPNPVIVLPGVTATYLTDQYELPPASIWEVLENTKQFERASLSPDDLRYEAGEPARVVPGQIYEIAYRELIEELRHNLTAKADEPVPVYPFGYDWRQPLARVETDLAAFVEEVIQRTLLMRHYFRNEWSADPRVDLVGHSMGGLLIAGYLKTRGANGRVGKVCTLATPFRGSYEAVIKVTTGTSNIGGTVPSSREREAARVTPSLYHLLPDWDGAVTVDGQPTAGTLFDPALWQPAIAETIAEFIRLRGQDPDRSKSKRLAQAGAILKAMLDGAKAYRAHVAGLNLASAGLKPADWLCVAGAGTQTRIRLNIKKAGGAPTFELKSDDRMDNWRLRQAQPYQVLQTGDGTVPILGAVPPFMDIAHVVCVSPDDYGYWELQDSVTTWAAGFHGIMPNMNMLHRLIVAHFTGASAHPDNIWGCRFPGVARTSWDPPIRRLKDKTADRTGRPD